MTPYKKFFTGMIGIVGGVCLGVGIGLGIVPLLSAGLLIVIISIGLLVSTIVNPVKTPITFQTHSIHAVV